MSVLDRPGSGRRGWEAMRSGATLANERNTVSSELDHIDRKLLVLLQDNGRMPYAELGKAVGLSISSANERVRKLYERGVIEGVHSLISPSALRLDLLAFVFVDWTD